MKIQEAIKACQSKEGLFARPRNWQGQGEAVDLGQHMNHERAMRVSPMSYRALQGQEWQPIAADLLDEWELVELSTLVGEVIEDDLT